MHLLRTLSLACVAPALLAQQPSKFPQAPQNVGDVKTGAYKHVLTAASRFGVRWLDDDHLIYEDGTGSLRARTTAAAQQGPDGPAQARTNTVG